MSPSYSPLDDSVYESFFHYIHLLYKSTCFVLLEKVTNAFGHKYDSFDEAYQATAKYVVEILEEARSRCEFVVCTMKWMFQPVFFLFFKYLVNLVIKMETISVGSHVVFTFAYSAYSINQGWL